MRVAAGGAAAGRAPAGVRRMRAGAPNGSVRAVAAWGNERRAPGIRGPSFFDWMLVRMVRPA
jgi:hypothetical protein